MDNADAPSLSATEVADDPAAVGRRFDETGGQDISVLRHQYSRSNSPLKCANRAGVTRCYENRSNGIKSHGGIWLNEGPSHCTANGSNSWSCTTGRSDFEPTSATTGTVKSVPLVKYAVPASSKMSVTSASVSDASSNEGVRKDEVTETEALHAASDTDPRCSTRTSWRFLLQSLAPLPVSDSTDYAIAADSTTVDATSDAAGDVAVDGVGLGAAAANSSNDKKLNVILSSGRGFFYVVLFSLLLLLAAALSLGSYFHQSKIVRLRPKDLVLLQQQIIDKLQQHLQQQEYRHPLIRAHTHYYDHASRQQLIPLLLPEAAAAISSQAAAVWITEAMRKNKSNFKEDEFVSHDGGRQAENLDCDSTFRGSSTAPGMKSTTGSRKGGMLLKLSADRLSKCSSSFALKTPDDPGYCRVTPTSGGQFVDSTAGAGTEEQTRIDSATSVRETTPVLGSNSQSSQVGRTLLEGWRIVSRLPEFPKSVSVFVLGNSVHRLKRQLQMKQERNLVRRDLLVRLSELEEQERRLWHRIQRSRAQLDGKRERQLQPQTTSTASKTDSLLLDQSNLRLSRKVLQEQLLQTPIDIQEQRLHQAELLVCSETQEPFVLSAAMTLGSSVILDFIATAYVRVARWQQKVHHLLFAHFQTLFNKLQLPLTDPPKSATAEWQLTCPSSGCSLFGCAALQQELSSDYETYFSVDHKRNASENRAKNEKTRRGVTNTEPWLQIQGVTCSRYESASAAERSCCAQAFEQQLLLQLYVQSSGDHHLLGKPLLLPTGAISPADSSQAKSMKRVATSRKHTTSPDLPVKEDAPVTVDDPSGRVLRYAATLHAAYGGLLPLVYLQQQLEAAEAEVVGSQAEVHVREALAPTSSEPASLQDFDITLAGKSRQVPYAISAKRENESTEDPRPSQSPLLHTSGLPIFRYSFSDWITPCYSFSRFFHRRLVSWGGLQLYVLLLSGWMHALFSPQPLTLLHLPRAAFLSLLLVYRGLVLYWGLNVVGSKARHIIPLLLHHHDQERSQNLQEHLLRQKAGLFQQGHLQSDLQYGPQQHERRQLHWNAQPPQEQGMESLQRPPMPQYRNAVQESKRLEQHEEEHVEHEWLTSFDMSDHVMLYVTICLISALEIAAARSSHSNNLRGRLLFVFTTLYYAMICCCCISMAFYTALYFHTPLEIWVAVGAAVTCLFVPFFLLVEVWEMPSLQRIGIHTRTLTRTAM